MRFNLQHDDHNYGVDTFGIITNHATRHSHAVKTKTFMQALRCDGTKGNNLFIYDPFELSVEPWPESWKIAAWLEELQPTLEAQSFLQNLEEPNHG